MSVQHHKKLARTDLSRYRPIRSFEKETQDLPVYEYKEIILEALKTHDIIIVAGETGSGKSTRKCFNARKDEYFIDFFVIRNPKIYISRVFTSKW